MSSSSTIVLDSPHLHPNWRRNLFAVTAACFIGFSGFTLVMPFLPLYFQELGVHDVGQIAFWSGVSLGVTPAMTALLSPLWGRLADRFGRKIMVQRSLVTFALTMAATGFVTRPWHVFALRALQGLFAGYGGLTLSMAAESAPRGRLAQSIGMVQTAQRLGPAIGPVIGGVLAHLVGLRHAFFVASLFYVLGFAIVAVGYKEQPHAARASARRSAKPTIRAILTFQHFLLLMGVIFGFQFVDRSLEPILPLYLSQLGVPAYRIPLISGVLFSVFAAAAALGHHWCRELLHRYPPRTIVAAGAIVAGVAALAYAGLPLVWAMMVYAAVFGVAVGAAMTAAYATAGSVVPHDARATSFGFLTSASLAGLALSPIAAGFIAATSIRLVFVLDAAVLLIVMAIVLRRMSASFRVDQPAEPTAEEHDPTTDV